MMPQFRWERCGRYCTSHSLLLTYLVTLPSCGMPACLCRAVPAHRKTSTGWWTVLTTSIPTTTKWHMTSFCYWVAWE
ncbi:uncharacterized protein F5891DRAFT_1066086 [Suillus fuscotomentosus]|uniref:Secreted protein n=1 Tax=Suillus fuscotomentosus TaxID=1912939 RepID=A0AAD4DT80_9AGAM|nr:uncharacterized protein F5891DRAFT_1066086 [Suillus fuscotomentosus]KAG1893525.1 hypothetical protein F5891DRAFT_1066086 [Suillus fuscotomentosus]